VGYDPLLRCPFPPRNLRGELEPRRTKAEVIRRRRPSQAVHAVRYPVKVIEEPTQEIQVEHGHAELSARTRSSVTSPPLTHLLRYQAGTATSILRPVRLGHRS